MSYPRDNCQCRIVPVTNMNSPWRVTVEYCPMHAAAPDLLVALKETHAAAAMFARAVVQLATLTGLEIDSFMDYRYEGFGPRAQNPIAKAEPSPPGRAQQASDPTQPKEAKS